MDASMAALLARVEKLEKEVAELKKFTGMPGGGAVRKAATGEGAEIMDLLSRLAPVKGKKIKIAALRSESGMDDKAFDNALFGLSKSGHVILHETGSMSLSLKSMGEGLMGENGELFTEVSADQG